MGTSRKFGWHSGSLNCYNVIVENDLTIKGSMAFGDASADTLTITGVASFNAECYFGTFALPTTLETDVPLMMVSGEATADQASGVSRCAWFRSKVSDDQTA